MGRKSGRGKEKKLRKKEEESKLEAMWTIIEAANAMSDPMESLAAFKTYNRHGLELGIRCQRATDLDPSTVDWAFDLTKQNMKQLYEKSEWGWNDDEKKKEMTDKKAWYLIVRDLAAGNQSKPDTVAENQSKPDTVAEDQSKPDTVAEDQSMPADHQINRETENQSKPVALVHFRFDMEDETQVLYCYEIQLCPEVRRKGLGKFLIQILQLIAFRTGMLKVMVTVFRHNLEAQEFFVNKLKFTEDETSPVLSVEDAVFDDLEGISYQILSRAVKQLPPPTTAQ